MKTIGLYFIIILLAFVLTVISCDEAGEANITFKITNNYSSAVIAVLIVDRTGIAGGASPVFIPSNTGTGYFSCNVYPRNNEYIGDISITYENGKRNREIFHTQKTTVYVKIDSNNKMTVIY